MAVPQRRVQNAAIFVCDLQDKFRNHIWQFDKVILTAAKVLRAAAILDVPVYVTTQNAAKLGGTVPELAALLRAVPRVSEADKTRFSMWIPEITGRLLPSSSSSVSSETTTTTTTTAPPPLAHVVITGIESHICVTQTALDALAAGHPVTVLADGVSSCQGPGEVSVALARLRALAPGPRGNTCQVLTSEAWLYELMGDAAIPEFRAVAGLVKESGPDTRAAVHALLGGGESKI